MSELDAVVKTVVVECSPDEAFRFFTDDFGVWWPGGTHSVVAYASEFKDRPAEVIFEPVLGGRIFERTTGGEEHLWGTVLEWSPPGRLVFSFHPGRAVAEAQTVEVLFEAGGEGTRVTLVHGGWEKLGAAAERMRGSYVQGWKPVFVGAFAEFVRSCAAARR